MLGDYFANSFKRARAQDFTNLVEELQIIHELSKIISFLN